MNHRLILLALLTLGTTCKLPTPEKKQDFISTPSGMSYKIIHRGYGDKPLLGETLKLQVKQIIHDSVLSDTRDSLPFYQRFDTAHMSKESRDVFSQVTKDDSLVFRVLTDSAFRKAMPPFAKKGEYLLTTVCVTEIFSVKFDVASDLQREKLNARKRDSINYFRLHPEDTMRLQRPPSMRP